jgi:hypothetical protein
MNGDNFVLGHAPAQHRAGLSDDTRTQPRSGGVVAKAPQPRLMAASLRDEKIVRKIPLFSMLYVLPIKIPEEPKLGSQTPLHKHNLAAHKRDIM